MGVVSVDTFGEFVIDTSVLTGVELGESVRDVVSVFTEEDYIENAAVVSSDVVDFVLMMVELGRLIVSPGDDVHRDIVWAGVESLGEAEKLDLVSSVIVVWGVLFVSMLPVYRV